MNFNSANTPPNPFEITKASDCTNEEIMRLWVDLTDGKNRLVELIDPTSATPTLLLGGKGSGKTHLMRYLSLPLQILRHEKAEVAVREERYLGIYFRCGGLDSLRFQGKGMSDEDWTTLFSYYLDLWIAQLILQAAIECCVADPSFAIVEPKVTEQIVDLFNWPTAIAKPCRLEDLRRALRLIQKEIDIDVNNMAFRRSRPEFKIGTSAGDLIFKIPEICASHFDILTSVQFVFLIDELENFTAHQQKYIQTLVRLRTAPCTFVIGARRYGVRTYETLAAGEINRAGSEFNEVCLDDHLREDEKTYRAFAVRLCANRLRHVLGGGMYDSERVSPSELLEEHSEGGGYPYLAIAQDATEGLDWAERPHIRRLMEQSERQRFPVTVINSLKCEDNPLLEKQNILLFYRAYAAGEKPIPAAENIRSQFLAYQRDPSCPEASDYSQTFEHFKKDLLAQLVQDGKKHIPLLAGLDDFITMSDGLPRNLLIILKLVFKWGAFSGELDGFPRQISKLSQLRAIKEAADWFLVDARGTSDRESHVRTSIQKLGQLFREIRYSDKPTEVSLITFSFCEEKVSKEALEVIEVCEKWSLLIRVKDRKDRNSLRRDPKYQLNRMLAPKWDLPIARRGCLELNPQEIEAIFGSSDRFEKLLRDRLSSLNFPFNKSDEMKGQLHLDF